MMPTNKGKEEQLDHYRAPRGEHEHPLRQDQAIEDCRRRAGRSTSTIYQHYRAPTTNNDDGTYANQARQPKTRSGTFIQQC
jgi:hypothetical protein